ncbi:MAG TPA: PAS domain S-box protein [Verrucomicrobiae bacterium]
MRLPALATPLPDADFLSDAPPYADWWKSFFEVSEDAQVVCRADGLILYINPSAARLFRLSPDQAEGRASIYHGVTPLVHKKLQAALGPHRARFQLLHGVLTVAEGTPRRLTDLEITSFPDDLALLTFKDATPRMRLESHVQRLITAIDATPDVFFLTDADYRLMFVNPAFHATTGHGIEEVLGHTDEFLRAPGDQPKVRAYLDAVSRGREWKGELLNIRRDGTTYHVEATISPISDMTGRFIGYVACERDITPRKRLEDELRVERDFVHSILHSLDGAIYTLDREFRLTHANDGWRRLPAEHAGIRLSGPPQIGRRLLEFVPDSERQAELSAAFLEVLQTGRPRDDVYQSKDGRHWLTRVSPWIHAQEVRGLICNVTDQTHYHELQDQLFQAQKMEIIGTLASGVAHDFNNLLQAIQGNTALVLLQTAQDSNLRHWAEQINVAAARAADITQDLLSFSRESEEKRTVLDLNQVMEETVALARRTLRGNVLLELSPHAAPLRVKVDSTRASQTLLNLCVNAQDAMPYGGRLTLSGAVVSLTPEQSARHGITPVGEFARCSVADTGTGIPPEVLGRIFEPFFTTKEKGKGTGLGLAIVQRVVKEAGGFVEVDTILGGGTTFHLYLPLVAEAVTAPPAPALQELPHGSGRVLVVDDLDLLRDFTKTFLEASGLTVEVAVDGPSALEVLERATTPMDILFTDYSMPGMNGIQLMEIVAQRWPHMRLILSSGYLDDEAQERVGRLNAHLLAKPYEMREASDLIMSLLPTAPKPSAGGG